MARVIWTEESLGWMRQIDRDLAERNPPAAARTLDGIVGQVELLATHPRIGGRQPRWNPREIRVTLYGKYQIFYELVADEVVSVLAVVPGGMDLERFRF